MGRHKTNAFDSLNFLHFAQKLSKGNTVCEPFSVGIDILTEQHDLLYAVRCKGLYLAQNLPRITAAFPSSDIGNDTICTEVIAPEHDIDARFVRILAADRKLLNDRVRILPNVDQHTVGLIHCTEQFCKFI